MRYGSIWYAFKEYCRVFRTNLKGDWEYKCGVWKSIRIAHMCGRSCYHICRQQK